MLIRKAAIAANPVTADPHHPYELRIRIQTDLRRVTVSYFSVELGAFI